MGLNKATRLNWAQNKQNGLIAPGAYSPRFYAKFIVRNGDNFHWDSPLLREEVLGVPAEIESIFVSKGCVIVRD